MTGVGTRVPPRLCYLHAYRSLLLPTNRSKLRPARLREKGPAESHAPSTDDDMWWLVRASGTMMPTISKNQQ